MEKMCRKKIGIFINEIKYSFIHLHVCIYFLNLFFFSFFWIFKTATVKICKNFFKMNTINFMDEVEIKRTCRTEKDTRSCFSSISNHRIFYKVKLFAKSSFCHPKPAVETRYGERLLLSIQK